MFYTNGEVVCVTFLSSPASQYNRLTITQRLFRGKMNQFSSESFPFLLSHGFLRSSCFVLECCWRPDYLWRASFQRRGTGSRRSSCKSRGREGHYCWSLALTSYNVFSRDAEVDRDKFVDEAKKLLVRATEYKEEAKREHEKMKEKWRRETLEESEKTGPLEEVFGSKHLL